jgi:channel protein (hemolysin III family)
LGKRATRAKKQLSDKASSASKYAYKLLKFEHLPSWLQDNRYITGGYRLNIGWKNSCHSMCHLHNETMNFWTHFVAAVTVMFLLIFTMATMSPHGVDRLNLDVVHHIHADTHNPNNLIVLNSNHSTNPFAEQSSNLLTSLLDSATNTTNFIEAVYSNFPSIQKLTSALREQSEALTPLSLTARAKFIEYLNNLDSAVERVKASLSSANINSLKDTVTENFDVLKHFTMNAELDLVTTTRSILSEFIENFKQELNGQGEASELNELQTIEERTLFTAVKVKVKPLRGLGSGNPIAGLKLMDINDHRQNGSDGSGSNNMTADNEGQEELFQLHSFLPRWPLTVFMVSAISCLLFSSIFHLFQAVNSEIAVLLQNLDYAGICLLIAGSNVPIIYYGFYCAPHIKWTYMSMVTALGAIGFCVAMHPFFRHLKYRTFKTLVFLGLGFSGILPLSHLMYHLQHIHFIFWYLVVMGVCYVGGAIVYLFHIPERYFPGKFDIWMASHQLWHLAIFFAVLTHYLGLMHMYEWRMMRVCSAS